MTQTNQLHHVISRAFAAPSPNARVPHCGTPNILSGLHPDLHDAVASVPTPTGSFARADYIGFLVTEGQRPNGLVLTRLAFGPLVGGIHPDGSHSVASIAGFGAPSSVGNACVALEDPNGITFYGFRNAFGRCRTMLPMNTATRATGCISQHMQRARPRGNVSARAG